MSIIPIGDSPWKSYMVDLYMSKKAPSPLGTVAYEEIEEKARQVLKDYPGRTSTSNSSYNVIGTNEDSSTTGAFLYCYGSAGTNSTYRHNLRAFQKYAIIPRMLVNATVRNLEVSLMCFVLEVRFDSFQYDNCRPRSSARSSPPRYSSGQSGSKPSSARRLSMPRHGHVSILFSHRWQHVDRHMSKVRILGYLL